jgi:hypothetical protein
VEGLRDGIRRGEEKMDIGLFIRYGKLVPGREQQAMDLFGESKTYFERKREEGVLTFFEPFLYMTSDREYETGFFVVKGPAPEIFRLMEEKDYLLLVEKAMVLVEHFQVDLLTVGEGITEQMTRAGKVHAELGLI